MNQFQVQASPQRQSMGNFLTILGLVNGMIGGTILVLPIMGIYTGYITTLIVCISLGYLTYYTSYLIILHLGKSQNISISVLAHFNKNQNYLTTYNLCIWLSFIPYFFIYFRLICLQIEGLLGYHSNLIGPIVAITLTITIILVRIYNCGEEIIGYGIISNVTYVIFLIWAQITAPQGPKTVLPMGDPIKLAGSLITAYSIHNILAQNMIKNPKRKQYPFLIKYTYIIGTIVYTFIAYGSFAMINRLPINSDPQTINDYFAVGGWQITIIQLIQVIHLYSAYPNFLLISNFFQMCNITLGQSIQWKQIFFIIFIISTSIAIYITNVHIDIMIVLNGAVIGFTYIFMYPIWIHLKCVFYDKSSGFIEGEDQWNKGIQMNVCQCDNTYSSKWTLYLQTFFLICVLILGLLFIVFTMIQISNNPKHNH